jgi:SnoaL-like protein
MAGMTKAPDFRRAVEAADLDALMGTMAPEPVLRSPVSFKPFEGHAAVRGLLEIVMRTFQDFRYTDELAGEDVHALVFRARIGDRDVEGMDLLRFDAEGRVRELTVMVRPASALQALGEAVGPQLSAAARDGS